MSCAGPTARDCGLRVGVNTGEVVAAEGGSGDAIASGDTLSTAARLEQSAQPGEILGLGTYSLVRDAVDAQPLEPLTLRGIPGPLKAYRLLRVTGGDARTREQRGPFVGRSAELERLEAMLGRAIDTRSTQLVAVVGPAGAGKSRLVQAFREQATRRAHISSGRCLSYGDGITYWPIAEIVRELAEIAPRTPREDLEPRIEALLTSSHDGRTRARPSWLRCWARGRRRGPPTTWLGPSDACSRSSRRDVPSS